MSKLNLKVLVPMYFEEDYEELCKRADGLGMDSLTEDEQYFVDNYHRLDNFMSQLSSAEVEELENANDNNEVYDKYANIEMTVKRVVNFNDKQVTVTMVGNSEDTAVNLIHKVMNGKYDERNNKKDSKKTK